MDESAGSALEASIAALKGSISALESSLKTLEGASTPWEYLAIISSFVVFFGIVGETIVIVSEDREDKADWARGIVRPPDRAPRWRFWFDIVATILVLLGVLGEAWGSLELASINSQLRSKTSELRADSDQLLALVTLEAGAAASSAEQANKALGEAQMKLKSVTNEVSALEGRIAHLNGVIASMEPRQVVLAEAEPDLIKRVYPFSTQRVAIFGCDIGVGENSDTTEIRRTEIKLVDILEGGAHWNIERVGSKGGRIGTLSTGCYPPYKEDSFSFSEGVDVLISPEASQRTKDAANALSDALSRMLWPNNPQKPIIVTDRRDDDQSLMLVKTNPDIIVIKVKRQAKPK